MVTQKDKKVVVVMPAYNAEFSLRKTFEEIPKDFVNEIILTDDFSTDQTVKLAGELGINYIICHQENLGYGANQKSCYDKAIDIGADIIVMLHPDYQYTPKLIIPMVNLINSGLYDVVLGSRILGNGALEGGMPLYKYVSNRFLTFTQNLLLSQKLSEYHTGYRAYRSEVLQEINYKANSNDFVFDNQVLAQIVFKGFKIGEISCPTKYDKDSSSINFKRSIVYGIGVLVTSIRFFFAKNFKLFNTSFIKSE